MGIYQSIYVALLIVAWYVFSIFAGIYNKDYLNIHPLPLWFTCAQALVGSVFGFVALKSLGLYQVPSKSVEWKLLSISSIVHCIGTILTNISTLQAQVSFTHTVKSADPLFTVILSYYYLGQKFSKTTIASIVVIVLGIALACTTEFSFTWGGFLTAMASNAVFSTRTIFSKKLLVETKLDNQNVFLYISFGTLLSLLPFLLLEIFLYPDEHYRAFIEDPQFWLLFKAGMSHYLYNVTSYLLLKHLTSVTHSVTQGFKRLFIIYCSILYFRNPVSWLNALASAIAVGGVLLYGYAK